MDDATAGTGGRDGRARGRGWLLRPSTWTAASRLTCMAAGVLAASIALTAASIVRQIESGMRARAGSELGKSLRLAHHLIDAKAAGTPVGLKDGRLVAGNGYALEGDEEVVDTLQVIDGGVMTIFRGDTRVATNVKDREGKRGLGTKLAAGPARTAVLEGGRTYSGEADVLGTRYMSVYEPMRGQDGTVIGALFVGMPKDEYLSGYYESARNAAVTGTVMTALGGLMLLMAVRRSFKPLDALRATMGRLAQGRLDEEVPGAARTDEVGLMAQAVRVLKEEAVHAKAASEACGAEKEARTARAARLSELTAGFEDVAGRLVAEVASAAAGMHASAERMSSAAEDAGGRTEAIQGEARDASSNVQAVAVAAEELTASVQEIMRRVSQSAEMTGRAASNASRTDDIVRALAQGAARAGDAGKGFAVVASEVKSLATQTTKATEEIAVQVGQIQSAVGEAVEAIRSISGTIDELRGISSSIADAVGEQGQATQEIAQNIQWTASGTDAVSDSIRRVAAAAGETKDMARAVVEAAGGLTGRSAALRSEVEAFVGGVRRA